jgi:hypothetical protein
MSRETSAHHDVATMRSPAFTPALVLHRFTPALSLPELVAQAALGGPISQALEHVRACGACNVLALCPAGQELARPIRPASSREGRDG